MPWVVVALVIGLVAVAVGLTALFVARRRDPGSVQEMRGDQLFTLGVIFTGTGVALTVTIGPAMIGIMALGIVYLVMGTWMRRREGEDHDRGMP
jgi:Ca2+/Na+ antiporter